MRGEIIVLLAALAVCAVFSGCSSRGGEIWGEHAAGNYPSNQISESENEVAEMRLVSSEFKEGENIPVRFTCQGENINPQLSWEAVPEGTKSFALIMDDPDAPVGTWVHWLVKDIPADARQIPEDSVPGKEVLNSAGNARYGGPCPPSGTHRYYFRLYALSVSSFEAKNSREFYEAVEKYKIGQASLMGRYKRG